MRGKHVLGPVSSTEAESIARRTNLNALDGMRILVTGSQGLIGNYLSQALSEAMQLHGLAPKALILQSRGSRIKQQEWAEGFSFVEHLQLPLDYRSIFPQVDVVVHTASPASPSKYQSPSDVFTPNLAGILAALGLERLPERQLFVSSGEVYGLQNETVSSRAIEPRFQQAGPRASYPNAKLAAETLLLSSPGSPTNYRVARLFHTFGPGLLPNDGRSFADILHSAARKKPIRLYSDGMAARNFAYLEDSVCALLHILVLDSDEKVFDVGSPYRVTIKEFAQIAAQESGVEVVLGDNSVRGERVPVHGRHPLPSTQPLTSHGWETEVSLHEGIRRTLEYIRQTS